MLSRQVQVRDEEIPVGWSAPAANFVNKLLKRKPMERLGVNGPAEVKGHPWLRGFDWKSLMEKKMKAPFAPAVPCFAML